MPFRFEASTKRTPPKVRTSREILLQEAKRAISATLIKTRNEMREASPVGGTGFTRASWSIAPARAVGKSLLGRVFSAALSAIVLDEGAKRHFPPVGKPGDEPALGTWIRRVLGITDPGEVRRAAFLISSKIRARGLPRRRLFTQVWVALRGEIDRRMDRMGERFTTRVLEGK